MHIPMMRHPDYPEALFPKKSREGDGAFDLYCEHIDIDGKKCTSYRPAFGEVIKVHTGICMAIPTGYTGLIFDRSGFGMEGYSRLAGVIDSNYRGEIIVGLVHLNKFALSNKGKRVTRHQRFAQILIVPTPEFEIIEAKTLDNTNRGDQGFGSSGEA